VVPGASCARLGPVVAHSLAGDWLCAAEELDREPGVRLVFGCAFRLLMKAVVMPLLDAAPINHAYHYLAGNPKRYRSILQHSISSTGMWKLRSLISCLNRAEIRWAFIYAASWIRHIRRANDRLRQVGSPPPSRLISLLDDLKRTNRNRPAERAPLRPLLKDFGFTLPHFFRDRPGVAALSVQVPDDVSFGVRRGFGPV
jgi:hypothetical protein